MARTNVNFNWKIDILLVLIISLGFYQCKEKNERIESQDIPCIERVSKNEAVISWDSKDVYEGVVYYKISDKEKGRPTSAKDSKESTHHKVMISDLAPSTIYNYWLKDSKTRYTLHTMPENGMPFSFLISGGDSTEDYTSVIKSEKCGFILSLKGRQENKQKQGNSYAPLYFLDGSNKSEQKEDALPQNFRKLDWGDLRLIMVNKETDAGSFLNSEGSHTIGIIFNSGILSENKEEIKNSALHKKIVGFNKKITNTCGCPPTVAFVGIVNYPDSNFNLDGITYFSIPSKTTNKENVVVINIDDESTTAYYPVSGKELILRMPPLQSSRICYECRRLGVKGSYEECIKAYKDFINVNEGKYNIEDAYLSVAKILDEKLFRFSEASEWYSSLIDKFPDGSSVTSAKQRLKYFRKNSDYNFEPLQKFERIKSDYAQTKENTGKKQRAQKILSEKQRKLLNEAEEITVKYPDSKVSKAIILWIANQFQQADYNKALRYYTMLQDKEPEFFMKNDVMIKIAETYFYAGNYKEAKSAYQNVKEESPKLAEIVNIQLKKIEANINRINIRNFAWLLTLIILVLSVSIKPLGMKFPRLKTLLFITAGYVYTFIVVFFVLREEIVENFNSYNEIFLFFIAFILILLLSLIVARTFTIKLYKDNMLLAKLSGAFTGTIFFISTFFLIIYYIYQQYLSFVNL